MNILFYGMTIIEIIELIFSYKRRKKILSPHSVFFVGITFNFLLYLLNWSTKFDLPCYDLTYTVIITSQVIMCLVDFIFLFSKKKNVKDINFQNINFQKGFFVLSEFILIACFILAAIENMITFKTLFPFLSNMNSHKNAIPIIGTLWRCLYPIGLFSFIIENKKKNKKKGSFIILIGVAVYLLIGGGSRFWTTINIAAALIFYFTTREKKFTFSRKILILGAAVAFLYVLLNMGMGRLQSAYPYSMLIGYNGPLAGTELGEVLAWYYGYFPYSFYNLNLTLRNIELNSLYTYGQFFFLPFATTIKIHTILDLPTYDSLSMSARIITNSSATVATAFFEFYADFGPFFFVPFLMYTISLYVLEKRNTVLSYSIYCYLIVCLFFFNFYNVISVGIPYTFILLYVIIFNVFKSKNFKLVFA